MQRGGLAGPFPQCPHAGSRGLGDERRSEASALAPGHTSDWGPFEVDRVILEERPRQEPDGACQRNISLGQLYWWA